MLSLVYFIIIIRRLMRKIERKSRPCQYHEVFLGQMSFEKTKARSQSYCEKSQFACGYKYFPHIFNKKREIMRQRIIKNHSLAYNLPVLLDPEVLFNNTMFYYFCKINQTPQ